MTLPTLFDLKITPKLYSIKIKPIVMFLRLCSTWQNTVFKSIKFIWPNKKGEEIKK